MKTCATCHQPFVSRRRPKSQQYCSRQCSADARGTAFYQQIGQKGGRGRSEKLRPGQIEKLKALAAGYTEPWEAFKAGAQWQIKRTNSTSYARGVRTGYAKGWEACASGFRKGQQVGRQERKTA